MSRLLLVVSQPGYRLDFLKEPCHTDHGALGGLLSSLSRRDGFARDPKLLVGVRSDFTVRAMLVDVESLVYDLRTCQGVVQTSRDRS